MIEKIEIKLNELEELIQNNPTFQELKNLQEKLLKNPVVLRNLEKIKQEENIYSKNYLELKKKLYEHGDYKRYQELENSFYYLSLEINQILGELTRKKECRK